MNKERGLYNTTKEVSNRLNTCKYYNNKIIWSDQYIKTLNFITEQWRYGLLTYKEYKLLYVATSKTFEKYISMLAIK